VTSFVLKRKPLAFDRGEYRSNFIAPYHLAVLQMQNFFQGLSAFALKNNKTAQASLAVLIF
jgi:hypothetical protein